MARNQFIDTVRGVDLILMVLFNYSVTLSYLGLIQRQTDFLYSFMFPRAIASIFIFLSGVAAYISYESRKNDFDRRYSIRGGKLLIFASFITLFTYIFVPEGTIYFGILHFFAISSFLIPFFIRYDRLNLVVGASIILVGFFLQQMEFDFPHLLWLGFMPDGFSTFDYFPLVPWLGVLMLGIYSGENIVERTAHLKFENRSAGIFKFLGKHSLTVYLLHQPVLIILLMVSGFKTF